MKSEDEDEEEDAAGESSQDEGGPDASNRITVEETDQDEASQSGMFFIPIKIPFL